jgi:diguanylate cyclase (GGDEF)-like protein
MDEPQDLSRRFRQAYGVALSGGIAMTLVSLFSNLRDLEVVRRAVGGEGDGTIDSMVRSAYARSVVVVVLLLVLWRLLLRPMADHLNEERRRLLEAEAAQRSINARQELAAQLHDALDMADDEPAVHRVVARAMQRIVPSAPGELLLADSSRAHLQRVTHSPSAGAAGCGVTTPWSCPAVRRGHTTTFASSEDINACPHLADRPGEARSALCVPVSANGRNLGVLHFVGDERRPPAAEHIDTLEVVASQAGARIGNIRAMATAQLQASTDGLTGLTNRRATSELVGQLLRRATTVAVAMLDLDHFKQLNDTHGHEAGDRALRAFADVARKALRDEDVIGRWGGEEFVVALPGLDRHEAAIVLDRIRSALADAAERADLPPLTVSAGVIDSDVTDDLELAMRFADEALLAAKAQGRDRVVIGPVVVEPVAATG